MTGRVNVPIKHTSILRSDYKKKKIYYPTLCLNQLICLLLYTSVFPQHSFCRGGPQHQKLGVDRYAFFRADADTDYYRPTRPITDILNRYMSGVKTINVKI